MKSKYTSQAKKSGKHLRVGGHELYYEEYGDGTPLLLLHGYGGCTQNWHPFVPELAKHYKLILVDLPGHGYSGILAQPFSHKESARVVLLLMDVLKIENVSAMGMSTGGMVLLHMAIQNPDRIKAMVLISATTHFPEQARQIMRRVSLDTMPDEVRMMYQKCASGGEEQIRQLVSSFNALGDDYDDMNISEGILSGISTSTLIIHGEKDQFFPLEIAESMCRCIRKSELWMIPGGEHVPVYTSGLPFVQRSLDFLGS
ncbi:MAG: alpha/beta fold hydrolase [Bacteroidetes bacterium]|nr:alpha/beta fold hydrolase [Bacteroidota bacterium]